MNVLRCASRNSMVFAVMFFSVMLLYWHVVVGMARDWFVDENSSHGFIVPLVSMYLIWKRKDKLSSTVYLPSLWGLLIAVVAIVLLVFGSLTSELYSTRVSLIVFIWGGVIYFYGWETMAIVVGPMAYLLLMIPVPSVMYDAIAFPLKLFVTQVSVFFLKGVGVFVLREGNVMMFPNITLEVVTACSGLRSLMSLLAVGLAYILLLVKRRWQQLLLLSLIFPVALAANISRVIITGILAQYFGASAAEGFFHEFAGIVIFLVALGMLTVSHGFLVRWSR